MLRWAVALLLAAPAAAAERVVTLTDFDRVRVDGPFVVEVAAGRGTSGRVSGTPAAIDATRVEVQGRTLVIQAERTRAGGGRVMVPVLVRITTPALTGAAVNGSGSLSVERMRGLRLAVAVQGSGKLVVARVEGDRVDAALSGSGTLQLAGTAATLTLVARGSGTVEARALSAADVVVASEGSGNVSLAARRSAKVTAAGSGGVAIAGRPACTVANAGTGTVSCGSQ